MAMSVEDGFARTSDDLDEWVAQSEVFRDAKKHAFTLQMHFVIDGDA